jgi:hypothetical protein
MVEKNDRINCNPAADVDPTLVIQRAVAVIAAAD